MKCYLKASFRAVITLIGSALSAFAWGGGTDSAALPQVEVIAPRPPDPSELAGESVPNFIRTHSRPGIVTDQLARWRVGVCPVAFGLEPAFNSFVAARIVAVAASVGAPHGDLAHCEPNVRIIFSPEPEKTIAAFAQRLPQIFGFHYRTQRQRLTTFNHPIQGWYITETEGENGIAIDDPMPLQMADSPGSLPTRQVPGARLGSRLTTGRNSWLVHVLIIADRNKVTGYTVGSVSDYFAMLTLSQTRSPDTCGQLPSILDLMVAECGDRAKSEAVTAGDLAFLKALYAIDLREGLDLERSYIQDNMMHELAPRSGH
jgi:hypothetical protein